MSDSILIWEKLKAVEARLLSMDAKLDQILDKEATEFARMAGELDTLTAEVARNTQVDQSAITLLTGLAAQIEALKGDPVALQGLADSLKSSSDALAAAVVANTPAEA